mgnify:CR=1 FL=1
MIPTQITESVLALPENDRLELARRIVESVETVSYTHLRAHETVLDLVCRLLLEKKKKTYHKKQCIIAVVSQQQIIT